MMNRDECIKQDIHTYRSSLSKQEQIRFDKVVGLHPKLTLLGASKVTDDQIHALSKSAKVVQTCLHYKQILYHIIYTHSVKELRGYTLGQTVYMLNKPFVICEFGENCFYPVGHKEMIDKPILLDLVTVTPRIDERRLNPENNTSLLKCVKKESITSNLKWFFGDYANKEYAPHSWFQRGHIWSLEQKQAYIKALCSRRTVFAPSFIETTDTMRNHTQYNYEILDGKQRIDTLLSFIRNEFDIDGVYYKDFSVQEEKVFLATPMVYDRYSSWNNEEFLEEYKVELFKQLNGYGTLITNEHIEKLDNYHT